MRNTIIRTLIELAEKDSSIMLLTGDLGYAVLEPFREKYPKQFCNIGIAEQNMAGVAAGLALEGKKVFFYSIGNFPTLRCMEQIRYDICYHNLNVKIIAVGSGYAYGPLGASHHTTEDLGMLRTIPNLIVAAPGDPIEVDAIARYLVQTNKPAYIRINKAGERTIHKSNVIMTGDDIFKIIKGQGTAVLTTGAMLEYTNNFILEHKTNWSLYSVPFLNNVDEQSLASILKSHARIITIEEHQLNSGFGSMVLERVNELYVLNKITKMPYIHRVGINNEFISTAGTQEFLRKKAGIILDQFL